MSDYKPGDWAFREWLFEKPFEVVRVSKNRIYYMEGVERFMSVSSVFGPFPSCETANTARQKIRSSLDLMRQEQIAAEHRHRDRIAKITPAPSPAQPDDAGGVGS